MDYVPANMPGCQMMSNLIYAPAQPEMYRMKLIFTPGSGSSAAGPVGSHPTQREFRSYRLSWWEKDSFFHYPYILVSAFYGMKWGEDFREYFNIPKDFTIIGDSGGFQNLTIAAKLNPISVLRWQERTCQIALTFDEPPTKILGPGLFEPMCEAEYREKVKKNVEVGLLMLDERQNKNLKLLLVCHGIDFDSLEWNREHMEKLGRKLDEFDGISISFKTNNLYNISEQMFWIIKNAPKNKMVHYLGTSSEIVISLCKYILQDRPDIRFTFDSSTYGNGAKRKEYTDENGRKIIVMEEHDDTPLKCQCPVCKVCQTFKPMREDGSVSGGLISLHNLYLTIQDFDKLLKMSNDELVALYPELKIYFKYYDNLKIDHRKIIDIMREHKDRIEKSIPKQKNLFAYG